MRVHSDDEEAASRRRRDRKRNSASASSSNRLKMGFLDSAVTLQVACWASTTVGVDGRRSSGAGGGGDADGVLKTNYI